MANKELIRIPKHIGIIPDGNRRWAVSNQFEKHEGYVHGISPGFEIYEELLGLGVEEVTFYGFTVDNTKRAKVQTKAFKNACVKAVEVLANRDANLLVIGNEESAVFPKDLLKYANKRVHFGKGLININFLVNYDWKWDLNFALNSNTEEDNKNDISAKIASSDISRIDMIIRWGGRRRLSGFLPVQSVYSDFYVVEDYWPDYKKEHLYDALSWYQTSDVTLGG